MAAAKTSMNYSGYFLIVSDFIRWSKANGIPVGPGRGSGAGSIVACVLQITDLDPTKFGLIFEKFLNPDRVSMPDFDIDFCQEKRDLVIDYVRKKYGYVAQIITFGKLQARAVLRDVGRVLQMPYAQVDYVVLSMKLEGWKKIPEQPFIVASKHQSPFETFIFILLFRNAVFVLKRELKWIPFVGLHLVVLGMIFINRLDGISSIRHIVKLVQNYLRMAFLHSSVRFLGCSIKKLNN